MPEETRAAELAAECARLRVVMMRCVDLCVSEPSAMGTCADIFRILSDELLEDNGYPKFDALGWPNTPESPQWLIGENETEENTHA